MLINEYMTNHRVPTLIDVEIGPANFSSELTQCGWKPNIHFSTDTDLIDCLSNTDYTTPKTMIKFRCN